MNDEVNVYPVTMDTFLRDVYFRIRNMDCGNQNASFSETTDLYHALEDAILHFGDAKSDDDNRDKKIIIVSNRANTEQQDTICDDFADKIRPNSDVDVVMVNIP